MTLKRAERLLGSEVELRRNPVVQDYYFAYADGIGVTGETEKIALQKLVDTVYGIRSKKVAEATGYRCERCGSLCPTETHHIKHRSLGGTHELTNLSRVCRSCHSKQHSKGKEHVKRAELGSAYQPTNVQ